MIYNIVFFFFFQAEDGIRDYKVTGVQTCALPIFVAAIEACTGAKCQVNAGKPDRLMLDTAMRRIGLPAQDCIMTGDRLSTDIAMAVASGMDSALVLTGETTLPMLAAADIRPTWVLRRIAELLPETP